MKYLLYFRDQRVSQPIVDRWVSNFCDVYATITCLSPLNIKCIHIWETHNIKTPTNMYFFVLFQFYSVCGLAVCFHIYTQYIYIQSKHFQHFCFLENPLRARLASIYTFFRVYLCLSLGNRHFSVKRVWYFFYDAHCTDILNNTYPKYCGDNMAHMWVIIYFLCSVSDFCIKQIQTQHANIGVLHLYILRTHAYNIHTYSVKISASAANHTLR